MFLVHHVAVMTRKSAKTTSVVIIKKYKDSHKLPNMWKEISLRNRVVSVGRSRRSKTRVVYLVNLHETENKRVNFTTILEGLPVINTDIRLNLFSDH